MKFSFRKRIKLKVQKKIKKIKLKNYYYHQMKNLKSKKILKKIDLK